MTNDNFSAEWALLDEINGNLDTIEDALQDAEGVGPENPVGELMAQAMTTTIERIVLGHGTRSIVYKSCGPITIRLQCDVVVEDI
jgi:hypothetical protein